MDLSTLANVATDDQPYLDFLSGYSVFNIGHRSRFSKALRGKTALRSIRKQASAISKKVVDQVSLEYAQPIAHSDKTAERRWHT
jgi:acetylornithine/succinyldiaminopimelate/putrescine aminotransferase